MNENVQLQYQDQIRMEIEGFFMIFAILLLFFDLIQLLRTKPRTKGRLEYGFYAATLAFGLIVISYGLLVQAFLKDDFSLKEVYRSSSSSLPVASKFFATWSAAGGSLLFLTFILSIVVYLVEVFTESSMLICDASNFHALINHLNLETKKLY